MQEQRSNGWDGRLITAPAGVGLVGLGEHLWEMRRGWEQAGHRVRRAALAWQAARVSDGATGIRCQALVNLEADIHVDPDTDCEADPLTGKDVVEIHETGIGRRRKATLMRAARHAGAPMVMVRDACQTPVADNV
jgi:hypothetical protein